MYIRFNPENTSNDVHCTYCVCSIQKVKCTMYIECLRQRLFGSTYILRSIQRITVQCTKCALYTVQGTSMYKVVLHTVRKYYKVHTACNCVCTLPEAESNLTNEHLLFVVLRAPLHKV